jgi:hypothetical protein
VPALEQIAGRDQIDCELIRPAGFDQRASPRRVAIARPDNAFAEIGRIAVGSNVEQPRSEIGVRARNSPRRESVLSGPPDPMGFYGMCKLYSEYLAALYSAALSSKQ